MDFPIILANNYLIDTVVVALVANNVSAQVSSILILNGTNFKVWACWENPRGENWGDKQE